MVSHVGTIRLWTECSTQPGQASLKIIQPGAQRRWPRLSGLARGALVNDLSAALVVAFLCASFALSFAALLFAAAGPAAQARGVVMMLTTCVVLIPLGTVLSSQPFFIVFLDSTLIAILAAATGGLVADLGDRPPSVVLSTLVVTVMLATIVTGAALWLVGRLRGGGVVRFVPYQVMAGVLAASGWSLVVGGGAVTLGHDITLASLTDPSELPRLLLALGAAVLFRTVSTRIAHPAALPFAIVGVLLLHHGFFALFGEPAATQRGAGWLLAMPPQLAFELPWSRNLVLGVDWAVLGRHAFDLVALLPLAVLCVLLDVTGIEAGTGQDVDVDRDLMANGVANMLCGALGGVLGVTSVSRTTLSYRMGVRGARSGIFAGLASGLVPLFWPGLIGLVPRYVLGALLLLTGATAVERWVFASRRRLTISEWLTVLAVLAIAVNFGLIAGVLAGLLLGCIAFAVIYSRNSPVRARYRGDVARSRVDRSDTEQALLAQGGDTLLVLHLQGFIFFGTADRLVGDIRGELAAKPGRLKYLLLDFSNVHGIDGSALASFDRLQRLADADGFALILTAMPVEVSRRLSQLPASPGFTARTLDEGLERCEDAMLAGIGPRVRTPFADALAAGIADPGDLSALLAMLQSEDAPAGAVLMRQGEISDDLLFIEDGQASVTVQFGGAAPMRVRAFGSGTMVGEIGFFMGLPRTATVQADMPCRIQRFTRAALHRLEADNPTAALAFQRLIIQRLGGRLLDKDHLIGALVLGQGQR